MGESTCLMHAFSYTPAISNEAKQGSPVLALGESISFGRFMSESLEWEKWSIFSHKRYVEEAERYAQPGSVAQKKAFFEAHYKRAAAKKAAALLEQANAANTISEPESGAGTESNHHLLVHSQTIMSYDQGFVNEKQEIMSQDIKKDFVINDDGYNSDAKPVELEVNKVGRNYPPTECDAPVENPTADESLNQIKNVELEGGKLREADLVTEHEALEGNPTTNEKLYQLKNVKVGGKVKETDSVTEHEAFKKNPIADESLDKRANLVDQNMVSIELTETSLKGKILVKQDFTSTAPKVPSSSTKPMPPKPPKKDNNAIPATRKPTMDSTDQKTSTPRKSLRSLINSIPTEEPDEVNIPSIQKESENVAPKHLSKTSHSENISAKTPPNALADGSKRTRPKWHILSLVRSNFSSPCHNKLQPSTSSSPPLRTQERAAKREQKHEENFNTKEAQKLKLQAKIKDKEQTGFGKLCQSFCFKAQPLPDFTGEREISGNQIRKNPVMHCPQPPKLR